MSINGVWLLTVALLSAMLALRTHQVNPMIEAQAATAQAEVTAMPAAMAPSTVEEQLSYSCGQNMASLVRADVQEGPLFAQGRLIFTSLEASDFSRVLLVNAGSGDFEIHLRGDGLNRIRFALPERQGEAAHTFYLSYFHGGVLPSRYFDYSEDRPALGHEDGDYRRVTAQRAPALQMHLNYAIERTLRGTLNALMDGRFTRSGVVPQSMSECEQLLKRTPELAKALRHDLDSLELLALNRPTVAALAANSRGPASVGSSNQRAFLRAKTTSSLPLRPSREWRHRVQNMKSK